MWEITDFGCVWSFGLDLCVFMDYGRKWAGRRKEPVGSSRCTTRSTINEIFTNNLPDLVHNVLVNVTLLLKTMSFIPIIAHNKRLCPYLSPIGCRNVAIVPESDSRHFPAP